MSKDDTGSKRPPREEDRSYVTMPPELRPFAKPMVDQAKKPGADPILAAAVAGIQILDGDPNADPFYYDVKKRQAEAKKGAGIGNASAYAAPSSVPASSEAKAGEAAAAKVVIAELEDPLSTRAVDVRAFRTKPEARSQEPAGDANENPPEAAASPWSKEAAPPEPVRSSALPSSLRPRDVPASASQRQVATPGRERTKTKVVLTVALVVVALGVGVAALTTRRTPENGSQGPLPTTTVTPAPPEVRTVSPPAPAPVPSVVPVPPAASSSGAMAPVSPPSATTSPERHHPAPKPSSMEVDPYADAAAKPLPAVTAPVAPVAPPAVTTSTPPPLSPKGPPTAPSAHPTPVSTAGPILGEKE